MIAEPQHCPGVYYLLDTSLDNFFTAAAGGVTITVSGWCRVLAAR